MNHLDGTMYRLAVVAGADWVRHTREQLNRINVVPVADGDTGTNMALSLSATASAVRGLDDASLAGVADRVAEASILGAKGNSGLILAHWFLGLSKGIGERARVSAHEIIHALVRTPRHGGDGLMRPKLTRSDLLAPELPLLPPFRKALVNATAALADSDR